MNEKTNQQNMIHELAAKAESNNKIPEALYKKYDVRRGLRNPNGTGVLVGLTEVGNVEGYKLVDGIKLPDEGRLYYRGYNIVDLVQGFQEEGRFGFEEITYLLLVGELPTKHQLESFNALLGSYRNLPERFTENMNSHILGQIEELSGKKVKENAREMIMHGPDEVDLVYSGLEETMINATHEIMNLWKDNPDIPDMRTAAYVVAINKVATSYAELGIFP